MKWIEVLHQFWIVCIPPKSKSKKPRSVADRGFLMVDKIGSIGCFGDLFNHHLIMDGSFIGNQIQYIHTF